MGVDYSNRIVYGKEFDSFNEALQHLVDRGIITEEESDDSLDSGEVEGTDGWLDWVQYSYYGPSKGVLGMRTSAKEMFKEEDTFKHHCGKVTGLIGEGCEVHEFVQVH